MEVSTGSPPPASPTGADDLCEIEVTNVAIDSVTLLISLCGLAGNGAILCLLHLNPITDFIFHQTITDILFLLFTVPSTRLFLLEDVPCSAIVPLMYLSLLFQLSLFSYHMGFFWLTFISTETCRSILCPLCCSCKDPERLFWVVMNALFWVFIFTVMAVNPMVTSLCQSHEQEHCQVALVSLYTLYLLLFPAPMVISSTIISINFKHGSHQQQFKRFDIVIFLTVLFSLPLSLWNFLQQLSYTVVSSQAVFLIACITSTIKPFIYFLVGSCRRHYSIKSCWRHWSMGNCWRHCSVESLKKALQRVFEEPEEDTACSKDAAMGTAV